MNYDLYLLYMYDRLEFPSSCKVSNYNSGRKLYPVERKVGSYKYGKSVLKYMYSLVFEADTSPFSVIEESFKAKHNLYFNKKRLVSVVTCKGFKKQYISQATNNFTHRWSNY